MRSALLVGLALALGLAGSATAGDDGGDEGGVASGGSSSTVEAVVTAAPIEIEVTVVREQLRPGIPGPVRARIHNVSGLSLPALTASLRVGGSVSVLGDPDVDLKVLGPRSGRTVNWRVCGTVPESALGIVLVSGVLADGTPFSVESFAFVVTVTDSSSTRRCHSGP